MFSEFSVPGVADSFGPSMSVLDQSHIIQSQYFEEIQPPVLLTKSCLPRLVWLVPEEACT